MPRNPLPNLPADPAKVYKNVGSLLKITGRDTFQFDNNMARAYLSITLADPLRIVTFQTTSDGSLLIAFFKYERIKVVCFACGVIGHTFQTCHPRPLHLKPNMKNSDFNEATSLWGDFMLVSDRTGGPIREQNATTSILADDLSSPSPRQPLR